MVTLLNTFQVISLNIQEKAVLAVVSLFIIRTNFEIMLKLLRQSKVELLWVKLEKSLFPFKEDVYVCHVYMPPNTSRVFNVSETDISEQLEISIEKYYNLGKIFITGDFNSHTASSNDYFEFDKYIDKTFSVMDTCTIPKRNNKDRVPDHYGLRMIDLCQCTGLLIANGRLLDDMNIGNLHFVRS